MLSFISLLWRVTVFARQQKPEQQSMFTEINHTYYEAMPYPTGNRCGYPRIAPLRQNGHMRPVRQRAGQHHGSLHETDRAQREISLKSKADKGLFCLEVINPAPDDENRQKISASRKFPKRGLILPASKSAPYTTTLFLPLFFP